MHRDQWLILLKEKCGEKYLPVYVDKVWADAVIRALRGEDELIDEEIMQRVVMGNELMLVIDADGDSFKAKFVGQGIDVECPVGKGLAVAARGGVGILVKMILKICSIY